MTVQAGIGDVVQRATDLVVGIFDTTFADIGHMAIGTGQIVLTMDTGFEGFIAGVLRFQHLGLAQLVGPIGKIPLVIIFFNIFSGQAIVPGEGDHLGGLLGSVRRGPLGRFEVIFGMTLNTDQGAHILMGGIGERCTPLGIQSTLQVITGDGQFHGFVIVAIGTTDRVDDFVTPAGPLAGEEIVFTMLIHQPRDIRGFAGPASGRHRSGLLVDRSAGPQGVDVVFENIEMTARCVVILGKTIAGPHDDQSRIFFEEILDFITFFGAHIRIVLPRIVLPPFGAFRFKWLDLCYRIDRQLLRLVLFDRNDQQQHGDHDNN